MAVAHLLENPGHELASLVSDNDPWWAKYAHPPLLEPVDNAVRVFCLQNFCHLKTTGPINTMHNVETLF